MKQFNPSLLSYPVGFINQSGICYFNSIIQSLLSCTSVVEYILENINENKMINCFYKALINQDKTMGANLQEAMVQIMGEKRDMSGFKGQQCAREGLTLLAEAMGDSFTDLFNHHYSNILYCINCQEVTSHGTEIWMLVDVEPSLKNEQLPIFKKLEKCDVKTLTNFILKNSSFVDEFKCKCGDNGPKYQENKLIKSNEILVVFSKKYTEKTHNYSTPFTKNIDIYWPKKKQYEAVAQIDHFGSLKGGHYVARCLRKNGWFLFDDNKVKKSSFEPNNHTYMVFYHIK